MPNIINESKDIKSLTRYEDYKLIIIFIKWINMWSIFLLLFFVEIWSNILYDGKVKKSFDSTAISFVCMIKLLCPFFVTLIKLN